MSGVLDTLGGLAQAERLAGAGLGDTAQRLFVGTFWSLAWEAEVYKLGLPVRGFGFSAEPVGTQEQIEEALARYKEVNDGR